MTIQRQEDESVSRLVAACESEIRSAEAVLLTVGEYAAIERVTVRTVRRWIARDAVRVHRTPGGRIRIVCQHPQR